MAPPACGTTRAAWRHQRHGEPVDRECGAELARYKRERRRAADERRTARERAMEALAWRHPTEFETLFRRELARQGEPVE